MVLGGTAIFGGRGMVGGTLLGVAAIALLQNGLRLADLPAELAGAGWMAVIEVQPDDLEAGAPGHASNCACCMPHAPLARLLSALFQRRARGTLGLFNRVCLLLPREAVLPAARLIGENPLLSGRYRVEKDRGEN